jgi:hypothetical protein
MSSCMAPAEPRAPAYERKPHAPASDGSGRQTDGRAEAAHRAGSDGAGVLLGFCRGWMGPHTAEGGGGCRRRRLSSWWEICQDDHPTNDMCVTCCEAEGANAFVSIVCKGPHRPRTLQIRHHGARQQSVSLPAN